METSELSFELSHPTRLGILRLLAERAERLSRIAEFVRANPSETSRHLDRLSAAGLVEKGSGGLYRTSPSGTLVLALLRGLDALAAQWDYFREHDLARLPDHLLARLGDLRRCERIRGTFAIIHHGLETIRRAETSLAFVANESFFDAVPVLEEKLRAGIRFRAVVERSFRFPPSVDRPDVRNWRAVPKIPAAVLITEKEAIVAFPDQKGGLDFSEGLAGTDLVFLRWCEDLLVSLWNQGEYLR